VLRHKPGATSWAALSVCWGCWYSADAVRSAICTVAPTPTPTPTYAPIGLFETYVVAMDGDTKDAFCAAIADKGVVSAADEFARLNGARPSEVYTPSTRPVRTRPTDPGRPRTFGCANGNVP
jgi:hypothetical protein